jgi:molybdopterin/thiamine biosynthesis adenylyltransferase
MVGEHARPVLLDATDPSAMREAKELRQRPDIRFVAALSQSLDDLFRIDFPFVAPGSPEYEATRHEWLLNRWNGGKVEELGVYALIPWRRTLVHLPDRDAFLRLRTARNKFLISEEEQQRMYGANIGIAGLSVGLSAVTSLTLSGAGAHLRIGDLDSLSIVNLNRLPGSVCDVGSPKTTIAARRIYELDPFAEVEVFERGLELDQLDQFLTGLDVFVEEMDDIHLKIAARFAARRLGVPVVMATDNGDNTFIDVERFDLDPEYPLFHGWVNEEVLNNCPRQPSLAERVRLADAIVGREVTPRTQFSLQSVGTRLPAWPQLGNAAVLSGVAVSYAIRRLVCGQELPSGRYHVSLDACLDPTYSDSDSVEARLTHTREFGQSFELLFGGEIG